MQNSAKTYPLPSAIDGQRWTVDELPYNPHGPIGGLCDPANHHMAVPLGPTLEERFMRVHEMAHAKWTPATGPTPTKMAKKHKCYPSDVQIVEDCRIHGALVMSCPGLLEKLRIESQATTAAFLKVVDEKLKNKDNTGEVIEAVATKLLQGCQVRRPRGHPRLALPFVVSNEPNEFNAVCLAITVHLAKHPQSDKVLLPVRAILNATLSKLHNPRSSKRPPQGIPPHRNIGPAAGVFREMIDAAKAVTKMQDPTLAQDVSHAHRDWAKFTGVKTIPLMERHRDAEAKLSKKRHVPCAPRIGHIRRLLTDGRAFVRNLRLPNKGGTVLIDTSGSMHIRPGQLHEILDKLPAATIAIYSGGAIHQQGHITIITRNARQATAEAISKAIDDQGTGNMIDGPALRWLAKQPEPRNWICDGIVTGRSDCSAINLSLEADQIATGGKIRRHASLTCFLGTLK